LHAEKITPDHSGQLITSSTQTISAFTFYISDTLYAIETENVLSVKAELEDIKPMPVKKRGILGVYKYQEVVVPVFDYAGLIGVDSGQQIMQSLIEHLEAREKDHIIWLDDLEKSIDEGVPFTKALNPHDCAFGKWYDNFKTRDLILQEILEQFDAPHKHIHSLANKLLTLCDNGKQNQAMEQLHFEKHSTLRRLQSLFHQAREQIKSVMRPIIIFTTKDGIIPTLGILVDEINDVIEYGLEDVQANIGLDQDSSESNPLFSGMYLSKNDSDSIICNIDNIIKH
jgi:chemotaxis signal transduction protein